MSVCLCLCPRPPWAPRPWPTHDGRSSISTARPSGHPSPASGHRRNGLFVLPAPCRSLGRGLEEMAIFCLGWWMDSRGVQGTKGRARLGCDRTVAGKAPRRRLRPCPALCLSLPSGISVSDIGIFPQQLSPARSLTPGPCHWVGWLRYQLPPGGRSPCQKSKMLDASCPQRLWGATLGVCPSHKQTGVE